MARHDYAESQAADQKPSLAAPLFQKERRKRRRRQYRRPGWVYRGQEVSQVEMRNVSGDGAGFVSDLALRKGERLHLKAGMGANRHPRLAEVIFVRERVDGRHEVGVRFFRGVRQPRS